jgi:hypothetical protein
MEFNSFSLTIPSYITANQSKMLHNDFLLSKTSVYDKCEWICSFPIIEKESAEYGACSFKMNEFSIKFRVSKTTPTKIGQFVTVWKRSINGQIEPFDISDNLDFVIISSRKETNFGQFIFPKAILIEKGIISTNKKGGKRGFRVYPPWDETISKQAQNTQKWQLDYFLEIENDLAFLVRAKELLKN